MSRFEAEKLHEVDELKTSFFTNISHEFRTPLTLILGPVKQMIDETNEQKSKEKLSVVHKNAKRLLNLVNQLLDIAKLESGNMKLRTSPQNIIPFLKAIVISFTSYAERKNITLKFETSEEKIIVYFDNEKFEKIITNVLSNAFKFTPERGKIMVRAESNDKFLTINISDTGVGIPKEKISKIFDRFYQVNQAHTREYEGTGIGLAFTKELIELHKGTIEVESVEGKGTTFKINIPLGKDHLKPEEIIITDDNNSLTIHTEPFLEEPAIKNKFNFITKNGKPILLIVEDNYDVRNYIKQNLENGFNITEACNGEEGWEKSISQIPDLIISDVMMPKLDGFKLCEKLKSDERTSHIPIILLTAKASSQDKINGFKTGADDYIMKPFEPNELVERIKNLIEQRKRIHDHFRKHGLLELDDSKVNNLDKEFLNKVVNTISKNISSESFCVELLAEKLFISRSLLHKKLVSLTGESPVELIRRIRLQKATELMEKKFGNISQIAMEVGFNSSAYFTECFKEQFGISPSQYLHKINQN